MHLCMCVCLCVTMSTCVQKRLLDSLGARIIGRCELPSMGPAIKHRS